MFTGIVEGIGTVRSVKQEGTNIRFGIECSFSEELRVDQSVAHNGVCLTVEQLRGNLYEVVAIKETLERSNLGLWKDGSHVNLERSMRADGRFEGHIVQGHVDDTAIVESIKNEEGSWLYTFSHAKRKDLITVQKGSICVNGVSLTVVGSGDDHFSVAIIPYTFQNTNFQSLKEGDPVNLEYDIIGKYLLKYFENKG